MKHNLDHSETVGTADEELGELKRAVIAFARRASTEISPLDENLLDDLARRLPARTPMYVAHTPKSSAEDVARVAIKVQSLGLTASPHIVARRLPSERTLRDMLARLREHGVEQALLVAGDLEHALGPFSNTLEVIATGALEESGLKRIGVAGHPEGHPAVGPAELLSALRAKQDFAVRSGIAVHIVTQFGFNPEAICAWARMLMQEGIRLPVHAGIAGPTPLAKLLKFAIQCGIGTSMRSLVKSVGAVASLTGHAAGPDEMLLGLVRGCARQACPHLAQPHVYSFGGALATAAWLRSVMEGAFDLAPDGRKFTVR
ncbi:MAG: methylenetetrahydrofolate reductase [Gammaproteobacteria bacterium]|nr:methylenetetrahydrofolate reductase [Gammaproteobacteria bacterium]MDE2263919.1 methylenetetrahydrofolate reductase [Gammaproteobacteria bacterium]